MKPTISYIICSMPRSGTHLLGEALQNTGRAGRPDEYFICDHDGRMENQTGNIANLYGEKTLEEFRQLVLELGSTANGVFGITIMGGYLQMIVDNFHTLPQYQNLGPYELLNTLFYNPKYIWLVRRDKVKQAVSIVKALQTNLWRKSKEMPNIRNQQLEFDYKGIEHYQKRIIAAEERWETYFKEHDIIPFKVVYEDLIDAYEQTAIAILDFLNIPTNDILFGPRQLRRQADDLTEDWIARYLDIQKLLQSPSPLTRLKQRFIMQASRLKKGRLNQPR